MNPWKTLNIKATDDLNDIKNTYINLKKQLSATGDKSRLVDIKLAYKLALEIANLKNEIYETAHYLSSGEHDDLKNQHKTFTTTEIIDTTAASLNTEEATFKIRPKISFSKSEEQRAEAFIAKIIYVAQRRQLHRFNLRHWRFIRTFEKEVCPGLRKQTAQKIFGIIAKINLDAVRTNKTIIVPLHAIKQMNNTFDWQTNLDQYKTVFTHEQINVMFPINKVKPKKILTNKGAALRPVPILIRIWLFALEIFGYSIPVLIIYLFRDWSLVELSKYCLISVMSIKFVIEFFSNQTLSNNADDDLGHRVYVVGEYSFIPGLLQVPARHFIINLSLFPIYAWLFDFYKDKDIYILNYTISYSIWSSVFINIILVHLLSVIFYRKFFHDIATGTSVLQENQLDK